MFTYKQNLAIEVWFNIIVTRWKWKCERTKY